MGLAKLLMSGKHTSRVYLRGFSNSAERHVENLGSLKQRGADLKSVPLIYLDSGDSIRTNDLRAVQG